MPQVTSRDGTPIAYDLAGTGPGVVLVGGGLDDGSENAPLLGELADAFTVVDHHRRGRGRSGDTQPYALEREIEDLAAVIAAVGGPVHLFGASSGGALVLEAAAAGLPVDRIAVFEVPYSVDEAAVRAWRDYVAQLLPAVAAGHREEAVALFMRLAGASQQDISGALASPAGPALLALAPTLAHDAACLGDGPPPAARLAAITRPTLVATSAGGDSRMAGLPADFFVRAADAIAACVPGAVRQTVDVREHRVNAKLIAPVLAAFFRA